MPFISIIEKYSNFDFDDYFKNIKPGDIEKSLSKDKLSEFDFLNLLSDKAIPFLEIMAQRARQTTIWNFGKVIQLFIPLYISNYCSNECVYCGFNRKNKIGREKLTLDEIVNNAKEISKTGIKHILFLTGEAPELTPMQYLLDTVGILKKYFSSISIEIFPMETEDYRTLKNAGVDGLTIYQETYDRDIYGKVHLSGRKKDYLFRLDTPERGAKAGFRTVGIGPLYGLGKTETEAFFCGIHAKYLQDKYIDTEISVSFPRINEAEGGFKTLHPMSDEKFVQFLTAFRLFLPRAGITVSTRERATFRDHLIPLGVTKMSGGSSTSVGGYACGDGLQKVTEPQFEVSDSRSVAEVAEMIASQGYEPVYKDWELL